MDFKALLKNKKLLGLAVAVVLVVVAHFLGLNLTELLTQVGKVSDQLGGLVDSATTVAPAVEPAP